MTAPSGTAPEWADAPTVDAAVFDELRQLGESVGEGFLVELIDEFVADGALRLDELGDALESGDGDAVCRVAHRLKGGSAQLGGQRLSLACARLEQRARQGQLSPGRRDLSEVEVDFADLRAALAERVPAPPG
jgi:two-component system sensor histidine kinase/response regulator